jgi:hypothetical protein
VIQLPRIHPPPCRYTITGNGPADPGGRTIRTSKSPKADDKVTRDSSMSGIGIGADWAASTALWASASVTPLSGGPLAITSVSSLADGSRLKFLICGPLPEIASYSPVKRNSACQGSSVWTICQ